ncbi:ATP-binding protein [Nonomuraea sp. NPDC050022]|uniref:ATP-binding protein n=1 Tax=Nonomuraea sp. NPDC050022 TaxID=3364358 RepID=UPI003796E48A
MPALLLWPLTADAPLARQARGLLLSALTTLPIGPKRIEDALLMVGEVAANAEKHAHPPYELRIYHTRRRTVVEFIDGDCRPLVLPPRLIPELTLAGIDCLEIEALERGRGLLTVVALAQGDCGVRQLPAQGGRPCIGKAIWFALPR